MKNIPLVVGNRVTYEWNEKIYQEIMVSNNDIDIFKEKCKKLGYKILNVEACLWEKIDFEEEVNDYDEMLEDYENQKEIEAIEEALKEVKDIKLGRQKFETWEKFKNKIDKLKKEIKEKKLFTEDEEEFLKSMIKWYNISTIEFDGTEVFLKENGRIVCNPDYPENMKFENIKEYKYYTLKELGLEV